MCTYHCVHISLCAHIIRDWRNARSYWSGRLKYLVVRVKETESNSHTANGRDKHTQLHDAMLVYVIHQLTTHLCQLPLIASSPEVSGRWLPSLINLMKRRYRQVAIYFGACYVYRDVMFREDEGTSSQVDATEGRDHKPYTNRWRLPTTWSPWLHCLLLNEYGCTRGQPTWRQQIRILWNVYGCEINHITTFFLYLWVWKLYDCNC